MTFSLTSPAFENMGPIPVRFTCEGEDISPQLDWEGVPENTRSLVLIVDDPDVPDPKAPRRIWVHWVLYNIPPETVRLSEDVEPKNLPGGTEEGLNDWKVTGYGGACPPIGRHRYFHRLYALDTVLSGLQKPSKSQLESVMKGHVIAQTDLVGTYQKTG